MKESLKNNVKSIFSVLMIAMAGTTAGMLFIKADISPLNGASSIIDVQTSLAQMSFEYEDRVNKLNAMLSAQNNIVSAIEKMKPEQIDTAALKALSHRVETLDQELKKLSAAISDSPEKSLAIPMMRRDISSLEKQILTSSANTQIQLERMYDLFKWICGTLLLGISGIVLNHFYSKK